MHRRLRRTGTGLRWDCEQIEEFARKAGSIAEFDQAEHTVNLREQRPAGVKPMFCARLHRKIEFALRLFDENGKFRAHQIQGAGVQNHS